MYYVSTQRLPLESLSSPSLPIFRQTMKPRGESWGRDPAQPELGSSRGALSLLPWHSSTERDR